MALRPISRSRVSDLCSLVAVLLTVGGIAAWVLWPIAENYWHDHAVRSNSRVNRSSAHIIKFGEDLGSTDGTVRHRATESLIEIGGAAVPNLIEALKDSDSRVQQSAALALGRIGPDAAAALPAITELTDDDSAVLRSFALEALVRVSRNNSDVVGVLRRLLRDEDSSIRNQAIEALARLGSAGVSVLVEALGLDDDLVRAHAAEALDRIRIDADVEDGLPILIEILMGTEEHAIWCVGRIMDDLGEKAKPAVPAILQALKTLKLQPLQQKDVANSLSRIDRAAWAKAKRDGLIPDDTLGSGPRSGQSEALQ